MLPLTFRTLPIYKRIPFFNMMKIYISLTTVLLEVDMEMKFTIEILKGKHEQKHSQV